MPNLSWYEAIEQTLRKTVSVMHITDLAEQIGRDGLREKIGATSAATVSAAISQSLKNEGAASPFRRVGPGEYILRDVASSAQANSPVQNEPTTEADEVVTAGGIIQAFGMYWERESVLWKNEPKLWGRQQEDADRVDFSGQRGVYLLYDGPHVVYVGRSGPGTIGQRLFDHTRDRLRGRWNRFSWFGLLGVTEQGKLTEANLSPDTSLWAVTLEAILIEGLEPPQNRKRGDDFKAAEYLQADDPNLELREKKALLRELIGDL